MSFVTASLRTAALAPPSLYRYQASRISMACEYAIELYGPEAAQLPRIADEAFDEVDRIDRLMSHYRANSPLSQINREAATHPVRVEPELFDFIADALRYTRDSGGAFDITVGPLMKAWGFFRGDGRIPAGEELAAARRHVGAGHVILNAAEKTIAFDEPGVELDLGGIAKGYAVDRVVSLLRQAQIPAALISAGGSTIYGLGAPPGRDGWDVAVQDPIDSRRTALTIQLKDRALSVAGRSEKSFEAGGVTYSHIMDPRTGTPVQGVLSVAVLTDNGTAGDALDDAFFVLGPERSRLLLNRFAGAELFFFLPASAPAPSEPRWNMSHQTAASPRRGRRPISRRCRSHHGDTSPIELLRTSLSTAGSTILPGLRRRGPMRSSTSRATIVRGRASAPVRRCCGTTTSFGHPSERQSYSRPLMQREQQVA